MYHIDINMAIRREKYGNTLVEYVTNDITSNVSKAYPENVAETVELFTYLKN